MNIPLESTSSLLKTNQPLLGWLVSLDFIRNASRRFAGLGMDLEDPRSEELACRHFMFPRFSICFRFVCELLDVVVSALLTS